MDKLQMIFNIVKINGIIQENQTNKVGNLYMIQSMLK